MDRFGRWQTLERIKLNFLQIPFAKNYRRNTIYLCKNKLCKRIQPAKKFSIRHDQIDSNCCLFSLLFLEQIFVVCVLLHSAFIVISRNDHSVLFECCSVTTENVSVDFPPIYPHEFRVKHSLRWMRTTYGNHFCRQKKYRNTITSMTKFWTIRLFLLSVSRIA